MALTTYSELQDEIAAWLHRSDITSAQIQNFIRLGESRLNDALRLRTMETTTALSLVSGDNSVSLPAGFLEPISLVYDDGYALLQAARDELDAWQNSTQTDGRPLYYAYGGTTIEFERAADATYALTQRYFRRLDIASDLSNTVLTNRPGAYLYASLAAAGMFLRDTDLARQMNEVASAEIAELIANDGRSRGSALLQSDLAIQTGGRYDIATDSWR